VSLLEGVIMARCKYVVLTAKGKRTYAATDQGFRAAFKAAKRARIYAMVGYECGKRLQPVAACGGGGCEPIGKGR